MDSSKLDQKKLDQSQWLPIGQIVGPQGLKGEVRLYPDSDFSERFERPGTRWLLRSGQTRPTPIELVRGRYLAKKGLYVLKLAGIDSREQAEKLRKATLLVPETDRPPLAEGEYHLLDLVGLQVVLQDSQKVIGTVVSLVPAGNDLLEIQLVDWPETALVPFVKALVPSIDLENGILEIAPPPGLLPTAALQQD